MTMDPKFESPSVVRRRVVTEQAEGMDEPMTVPTVQAQERVVESGGGIELRERSVRDLTGNEHREQFVRDVAGEQEWWIYRASQMVWFLIGVIEVFIGLRILLKLLAANPNNAFANFVYNTAGVFLAPFFGLTGSPAADGMVLEVPSLIAMAVYALLGWGVERVIWLAFIRPLTRSASTVDRYRA